MNTRILLRMISILSTLTVLKSFPSFHTNKRITPTTLKDTNTECTLDIIPKVERIFAISDLHTDDIINMKKLKELCSRSDENAPNENDCIIIAGDISHEISTLKQSLQVIQDSFNCHIFFVPGNHEAWISPNDEITTSIQKLELVLNVCQSIGIRTDPCLVGTNYNHPTWIVPLLSWYDDTLNLPHCEDLTSDFSTWPWTDFRRCKWPSCYYDSNYDSKTKIPSSKLVHYYLSKTNNAKHIIQKSSSSNFGLITVSHFLPSSKTLPDWKDISSPTFSKQWLDHGQPGISAKFAKVAGSNLIETYIRSFQSKSNRHIHVFGHSHRPKDFIYNGIRYIHNPMGKPWERDLNLCNPNVSFECIWDTTTKEGGMVNGNCTPVIRYWEDYGGGKDLLIENIVKRRKLRQEQLKAIMNKTSIF